MARFPFIKSVMVADRSDGVEIFELKSDESLTNELFSEQAGGISAIRLALADLFNSMVDGVNTLKMGQNKSLLVTYDKLTVLKKRIHTSLVLLIICETEGLDLASLFDVADEFESNFKEVDALVEKIDKNSM